MKCTACGHEIPPGGLFCNHCGAPAAEPKPNKKKGKALLIVLVSLALALAVAAAILLPVVLGPLTSSYLAVKKTMRKGSFSFDLSYCNRGSTLEAEGEVELDVKARELTLVAEVRRNGGIAQEYVICDGYLMTRRGGGKWSCQDYSDELDRIFDALAGKGEKFDLRAMLKDRNLLTIAEGYLDLNEVEGALMPFALHFNDEDWLEKNAGYYTQKKKDTAYYVLDFGLMAFLEAAIEDFENAFLDPDFYEKLRAQLAAVDREKDIPVLVKIGLRKGTVRHVQARYGDREAELWLEDVGDTHIDKKSLRTLLKEVEGKE